MSGTRINTMRWLTVTALVAARMAPVGIAHAAESCMGKAATIVGTTERGHDPRHLRAPT